jgi:serine/threonine protein phosphatase PrpC
MNKVFFGAAHIGVKANQDRSSDQHNRIILCDGVGEFPDSGIAAECLIKNICFMEQFSCNELLARIGETKDELKREQKNGGTTLLMADLSEFEEGQKVNLACVGNGAIFHFRSDLPELGSGFEAKWKPHRFTNLFLPHVEKDTALTKYIGPGVHEIHSTPTIITMQLNSEIGDALLLVTDGIASLENDFLMQDDAGRIWQLRSSLAHSIMLAFIKWLQKLSSIPFQEQIRLFLDGQLTLMKKEGLLEDDGAVGLIFTKSFLDKTLKFHGQATD